MENNRLGRADIPAPSALWGRHPFFPDGRCMGRGMRTVYFLVFLLLGLLLSCGPSQKGNAEGKSPVYRLVVLHTNDTHGHPVKFHHFPAPHVGGLPARATLVRQIRKEHQNVLVLDAGDLNTGRQESNLFQARPDILGMNYIGYDAMVLGNHEFDHPFDVLKEQMALARFPFLSANIKTKNGKYLARPFIIKPFKGFKVAVLGLTTKDTEIIGHPDYIKELVFEDEVEVARKLVPELRKKADVVIALTHMGLYPSAERGSKRLASEVDGIDLIVDGNTHARLYSPVFINRLGSAKKTPIVQAWQWGLIVGRVDLWIQDKKIVDLTFKAIPINLKKVVKRPDGARAYHFVGQEIQEDETLLKLLQPYVDKADSLLSEVIGYAEATFWSDEVRKRETALGDIVADSMLWYARNTDVDFAILNGGSIRKDLPAGTIRKKLIYEILPFDSSVVVVTLRGSDVRALFKYIATLSPGAGAFPQVSEGLRFAINHGVGRCENILIRGKPIDPNRIYRIATNSYLAGGGDGYSIFSKAVKKKDS
ncbi:MAG: bifunctional metallophosphatase/5'-nucleotidase, partial [Deltaproteobacteria bacterium]|nr:bifunctional metallophosphatase/5'-nucleotidase [Deltaproteobacteria bacterium]